MPRAKRSPRRCRPTAGCCFKGALRIDAGHADGALHAQSDVLVDVQVHRACGWPGRSSVEVGCTPHERIVLNVPAGYLVEKISGDNVRGWSAPDAQQPGRLEVQFLRPAISAETILVRLSDRTSFGDQARSIAVPQVALEGAALQSGRLTIRRSTVLDVETLAVNRAARTDLVKVSPQLAAGDRRHEPAGSGRI